MTRPARAWDPSAPPIGIMAWVDLYDAAGLGNDVPLITGTLSDSIKAVNRLAARTISAQLLYSLSRRADRRSKCWLERERHLGRLRAGAAMARRRRQRHDEQDRPFSSPARSVGALGSNRQTEAHFSHSVRRSAYSPRSGCGFLIAPRSDPPGDADPASLWLGSPIRQVG